MTASARATTLYFREPSSPGSLEMSTETHLSVGMISGFQVVMALWAWAVFVLLHALWRSMVGGTEQDPIRESGPPG